MKKDTKKYDIKGWATKANVECTDGRIIRADAFKHQDGARVPLVWNHEEITIDSVFGHADLAAKEGSIYANVKINDTPAGVTAKELIASGDVNAFSIRAKNVLQKGMDVLHGDIAELSLVLSGANPGAVIEQIDFAHADGVTPSEMIIQFGEEFTHAEEEEVESKKSDTSPDAQTVQDILDSMTEEQYGVTVALVSAALESGDVEPEKVENTEGGETQPTDVTHSDDMGDTTLGGTEMSKKERNIFEKQGPVGTATTDFQHGAYDAIVKKAIDSKGSLKKTILASYGTELAHSDHATGLGSQKNYGIRNIEIMFPEAQQVGEIQIDRNEIEWVSKVIAATKKTPFSRIRTVASDLTDGKARAKGYITADEKEDVFFELTSRETTPQTVYIRSKFDRDDIIDATQLNVVMFQNNLMKEMWRYEVARAIIMGDGRKFDDKHKIKEDKIRPIIKEHPLYAAKVNFPELSAETQKPLSPEEKIEYMIRSRKLYKGSGRPTLFVTGEFLADMLLVKDKVGRRIYNSQAELESTLRVSEIVEIDDLEDAIVTEDTKNYAVEAIMVNLSDYALGTDRGGELVTFEDFDIDFNQFKYLMEGRMSGALVKIRSAVIFRSVAPEGAAPAQRIAPLETGEEA